MPEIGKLNLRISVISNELEIYVSFTVNIKLSFIDSFQFLSFSLDSLVQNLNKDYLQQLSQEFDNNALDLVNQKGVLGFKVFYPYFI